MEVAFYDPLEEGYEGVRALSIKSRREDAEKVVMVGDAEPAGEDAKRWRC